MTKFFPNFRTKKFLVYSFLHVVTFALIISAFTLTPKESADFPLLRGIIIFFASILLLKYFLYMVISPWHDVVTAYRNKKYARKIERYKPLVSVLIPAWNEEKGILKTVETILESRYRNMEIIIVNDGSTDSSDKLIRAFIRKYHKNIPDSPDKIKIIYHYKQNGGKGAALNTALTFSSGDLIMSIDADCVVLPETIGNFVRNFVDPKIMAAVGNVKVGNTQKIVGVVQYLEFLFSFYFKKADSVMNTIYIIGGAAGVFRSEVFEKLGGYNITSITEDIELSMRIQNAGMKVVYADDAVVYTEGASEVPDLMKQRLRWKRGRFETFFEYRHMFFSRDSKHNKLLSWILLPLGYFGELQLSLELLFVAFLYAYSAYINDFSSFISGIIIVGSMFFVQIAFDDKKTKNLSMYLLSPIGWLLFYIATFVEVTALFKTLHSLLKKEEVKWQRWQRRGVHG